MIFFKQVQSLNVKIESDCYEVCENTSAKARVFQSVPVSVSIFETAERLPIIQFAVKDVVTKSGEKHNFRVFWVICAV